jgi:hypothetical protein
MPPKLGDLITCPTLSAEEPGAIDSMQGCLKVLESRVLLIGDLVLRNRFWLAKGENRKKKSGRDGFKRFHD